MVVLIRGILILIWLSGMVVPRLCAAETYAQRLADLQTQLTADPTNQTLLFKLGDFCFDEGAKDNREAVKLAEKYFSRLMELNPNHARALAMLGSTFTMKGRDALWPPTRMKLVREGIKKMDAAAALAPDDPAVRFTRAFNNFHMPKFMEREAIVQADFEWLWAQLQSKPGAFDEAMKQNVARCQGTLLKRQGQNSDALAVWRQGIAFNPASPIAQEIQELVKKTKGHENK
jgi:tetratricopeptide (TPR) repeat protein